MSREKAIPQPNQAEDLLSLLGETVGHIEADDLSGLAQMHGWCETLIGMGKQASSGVDAAQVGGLTQLARKLEDLILGEVADAAQASADLVRQVAEITGAAIGQVEIASTSAETSAETQLTDAELSKRLSAVFEEDSALTKLDEALPESGMFEPGEFSEEPVAPPAPEPLPSLVAAKLAAPARPETKPAPANDVPAAYVSEPLLIDTKEIEFLISFVQEAREHIESVESAVLEVERTPEDSARIDDLFRPFHTIKGMAGFLNLRDVSSLTHEVETLMDQARKGKRSITPGVIDLVLAVVDILKVQIASIGTWVANPTPDPVVQPPVSQMIDRLRSVVAGLIDPDADADRNASVRPSGEKSASQPSAAPGGAAGPAQDSGNAGASATGTAKANESIRIDTDKLDALIEIVGELVIAQTLVNMSADVVTSPKLVKDVTQVTKIVRDVQEMAMVMRMVPIGPTFQKMARLVRDVSRKAGKTVELIISGNETELDKTVIQEIGDPLVHMVRNAVDHGVETPDARVKLGKPEVGRVYLHASHEGGNIVISIRDDGKGLDPAVLLAKGIEKGLVQPNDELTEQQIFQLVFAPGFSTASQVTDISGRGVGMDVVKRNIDQLRGRVEISSVKGEGTTFTIRLPLTMAIIDGIVIRLGGERFIIPTITIQQSLRPLPEAITTVQHRGEVLNVRGKLIPLIQMGELFGLTGRIDPCQAMVVIAHCEGRLIGMVVDELIGQQQVVIKTLGEQFKRLKGISGAAILGDGRVGLILEMTGVAFSHDRFTRSGRRMDLPVPDVQKSTASSSANITTVTEPADPPAVQSAI